MNRFNPLGRADDRDNFAPSEESYEVTPSPITREVVPERGYEIVTDTSQIPDGTTVRVWRGSRWRGATVRGKTTGNIASVVFLAGGSGTPHISRLAIRSTRGDEKSTSD